MKRKGLNDDQFLMFFTIFCITLMILCGLVILAFAPQAEGASLIPLVALGVGAISAFARQPSFPAAPVVTPEPDTKPAVPPQPAKKSTPAS